MTAQPGSIFYFLGLMLVVLGNVVGVIFGVLLILVGVWLWRLEDLSYIEDDDLDDGCPICGTEPGQPCLTTRRADAEPAPTFRPNLRK